MQKITSSHSLTQKIAIALMFTMTGGVNAMDEQSGTKEADGKMAEQSMSHEATTHEESSSDDAWLFEPWEDIEYPSIVQQFNDANQCIVLHDISK